MRTPAQHLAPGVESASRNRHEPVKIPVPIVAQRRMPSHQIGLGEKSRGEKIVVCKSVYLFLEDKHKIAPEKNFGDFYLWGIYLTQ